MKHRVTQLAVVSFVALVGLAVSKGRVHTSHDLDSYSDAQLRRDLLDELDDITLEPDGQYSLADLHAAIVTALADDGDEGAEEEIDLEDLDDEMKEADTTLDEVVDHALALADDLAMGGGRPGWRFLDGSFAPPAAPGGVTFAHAQSRNVRRGFTTTRVAIAQTTDQIIVAIRKK